jgi:hypothetical protein
VVTALATLGHGEAYQIAEQRLGQMTDLRMAGKCRRERAAGAPNDKSVLPLLNFRETSQLSQHRERLIHPVPRLAHRHGLTGGHAMPHFAHGVIDRGR